MWLPKVLVVLGKITQTIKDGTLKLKQRKNLIVKIYY
jgi:hypothetical protein